MTAPARPRPRPCPAAPGMAGVAAGAVAAERPTEIADPVAPPAPAQVLGAGGRAMFFRHGWTDRDKAGQLRPDGPRGCMPPGQVKTDQSAAPR